MAETIDTLRARVDELETEIRDLAEKADITPEEDARLDEALDERDANVADLEKLEAREARVASVREAAANPKAVKPAIEPVNVNTRTSTPFDLDELRSAAPAVREREIKARARTIVDENRGGYRITDEAAGKLDALLSRPMPKNDAGTRNTVVRDVAEMIVQTGSEEYREAFEAVLADPASVTARMEMEARQSELLARAAIKHDGVAGALHVPYQLDPTLILNNAGIVDPVRALSRVEQISGTDRWVAPTSAGITAGYVSESAAFTDNSPTYTSTTIVTYKAGAFAFGSYEALADSGAAGDLGMMFADAKQRFEGAEFATGTGSSAVQGVVVFASNTTSLIAGSSGAANSKDFTAADIYATQQGLSPRWRQNAVWMGSLQTANSIRQFGTSTNFHAFTLDLKAGGPPDLLGRTFYENSSMDTTIVSGSTDFSLIYGDFSQFVVVDRVGLVMKYQDIVTSGSKFPTGESAWHVYWRFGSGGLVQDAFRMLQL